MAILDNRSEQIEKKKKHENKEKFGSKINFMGFFLFLIRSSWINLANIGFLIIPGMRDFDSEKKRDEN